MLYRNFRKLLADRNGATAIMIGVMAAMLIGVTSLGAEVAMLLADQRKMQSAADSAAISAANAQVLGVPSPFTQEGFALAADRGFSMGQTTGCPSTDPAVYIGTPCDGPHAGDSTYVEALIKQPRTLSLASVVNTGTYHLQGRAIAHIDTSSPPCALALDPTGKDTITVSGGTNVNFLNCGLAANSNDPAAIETKGSGSTLTVSRLLSGGSPGYNAGSGTISAGDPAATTCTSSNTSCVSKAPPALNPYSNLPTPSCSGTITIPQGSSITANPGCYKDLKMSGGHCNLTLASGTYYFSGDVTVNCPSGSLTSASGGVTIVLTGTSSNVSISAGAQVTLSAQTSGTYAGVLFYSPSSTTQSVLGGSNMTLTGAIVFPNALVKFAGNTSGTSPNSPCTTIIAWQMQFTGGSGFAAGCTGTGVKPIVEPATLIE